MLYSRVLFLNIEVEMAGGSQIIINDQGITIKTGGKVVFQAGQHKFESGAKIKTVLPTLPVMIDQPYSAAVTFLDDAKQPMVNYNYRLMAENGIEVVGVTDEFGKTQPLECKSYLDGAIFFRSYANKEKDLFFNSLDTVI